MPVVLALLASVIWGTGDFLGGTTSRQLASATVMLWSTALAFPLLVTVGVVSGDLQLDAPITRYLPEARLPEGVDREAITVRDLVVLTHGLSGSGPVVIRTAFTGQFTRAQLLVNGVVVQDIPPGDLERFGVTIANFQEGANRIQIAVVDSEGSRAVSPVRIS